jgi:hypothetical protein
MRLAKPNAQFPVPPTGGKCPQKVRIFVLDQAIT